MKVCAACGEQNPDKAKFCMECTAPLAEAPPRSEERKVITVLFADLVGFTSRSERLDIEDVRALLGEYHALLRSVLERYQATVEKFAGDAVLALFGAPRVREDDALRAVEAGLSIQAELAERRERDAGFDLHVRVGVNTGEVVVALGARPVAGEAMAFGDAVNTAARLQSAAPVDGVLVGEVTYRATSRAIEYAEAEPVLAKGKAEPVRVWVAREARSRLGLDVQQAPSTPLVGREREARLLWEAFERSGEDRSPQLVTLVGVPGIGKSRLVWELFRRVEEDQELVTWRQGRSLPYGEGVAFWALGEMVKAQAGVLHSDCADTSGEKLQQAVADVIRSERDAAWIESHLRPLLGLDTGQDASGDRQAEAFAAWRRFIEALAERGPTVLVFEDLHWADEALLDFIDQLAEHVAEVPLLVLCTARPELLERRNVGADAANATTISLSPLSPTDTERLVSWLLDDAALPSDIQSALLERAGGNALYAREFVAMLVDRGLLLRHDDRWVLENDGELPLPETLHGVIAARLDLLSRDDKVFIQDAAVLGQVFWAGAVAELSGRRRSAVDASLDALTRRRLIRQQRDSSVEGDSEYAFDHALIRDVAYATIVRRARAERHERAARWIEALEATRTDRSEMIAHHYDRAVHYAAATEAVRDDLRLRARTALWTAGRRAMTLGSLGPARSLLERAAELSHERDVERGKVLGALGRVLLYTELGGQDVLRESCSLLRGTEEVETFIDAQTELSVLLYHSGDEAASRELFDDTYRLVRSLPATERTPRLASVLGLQSRLALEEGRGADALRFATEAVNFLPEDIPAPRERAYVYGQLGLANLALGNRSGLRHLREATRLRISAGDRHGAALDDVDTVAALIESGDIRTPRRLCERIERYDQEAGHPGYIAYELSLLHAQTAYWDGDWDGAAAGLMEPPGRSAQFVVPRLAVLALIAYFRGPVDAAVEHARVACDVASGDRDIPARLTALLVRALVLAQRDPVEARHRLDEAIALWSRRVTMIGKALPVAAMAANELHRPTEALAAMEHVRMTSRWKSAARLLLRGEYLAAANQYRKIGSRVDEGYARLLAAHQLIEQGRRAEGEAELEKSLAFWRRVGASAYIRECEALLARAATA